jgi:formate hydrogenlyase subunit 6/NADH:ubiquinone oxidoreductase subunit I
MESYLGINPQLCTGCRTCVLACSLEYFGVFSLEKSYISVSRKEEEGSFDILIKNGCIPCHVCEENCPSGALVFIQKENQ